MSEAATKSVYSVDAFSDPVVVRVDGRACFQNSTALRDFIGERVKAGKRRFVLDFQHCASVDSTFLGVLAGAAIELRKLAADASLVVTRVSPRNLELMRNLGLHRLLTIDVGGTVNVPRCDTALEAKRCTEIENARLVLAAHESLVTADEANRAKFQDVLSFLRTRVEQG
ncbi:MAG TPA: STAS domain-containing protein [Opitutaceae bacterium]